MKLTKSKLKQLIREALTENWQDEAAALGGRGLSIASSGLDAFFGDRPTRRVDPRDEPYQSRAGREQQRKWAAEENKTIQLPLTYNEYELILAAFDGAMDADTGFFSGLENARENIVNAWEEAAGPDDPIPVTKSDLIKVNTVLTGASMTGLGSARTPSIIKKVQSLLRSEGHVPEPEQEPEPEAAALKRSQLGDKDKDPRFFGLEFDEALKRYEEGQTMKLTKTILVQLIREELAQTLKEPRHPVPPVHPTIRDLERQARIDGGADFKNENSTESMRDPNHKSKRDHWEMHENGYYIDEYRAGWNTAKEEATPPMAATPSKTRSLP